MDRKKMIVDIIKEHNERDEHIYWKKLAELLKGKISGATISKIIDDLIEYGTVREEYSEDKRTPLKYLYVNEPHAEEGKAEEAEDQTSGCTDEVSEIKADIKIHISIVVSDRNRK